MREQQQLPALSGLPLLSAAAAVSAETDRELGHRSTYSFAGPSTGVNMVSQRARTTYDPFRVDTASSRRRFSAYEGRTIAPEERTLIGPASSSYDRTSPQQQRHSLPRSRFSPYTTDAFSRGHDSIREHSSVQLPPIATNSGWRSPSTRSAISPIGETVKKEPFSNFGNGIQLPPLRSSFGVHEEASISAQCTYSLDLGC